MGVHIYKTRANHPPIGVDDLSGRTSGQITNCYNKVAFDRNVGPVPGCACAINQPTPGD
jgi:hypothetical protein